MSRFLSRRFDTLAPYVPGEQPRDRQYIKLNTNESPYPPSPAVLSRLAGEEARKLNLYPDPDARDFRSAVARHFSVKMENVLAVNGSDEALSLAFMGFCDADTPARFADITYGFYRVFAALYGVPFEEMPLSPDFSIDPKDYFGAPGMVVIANPNAPTGLFLPLHDIEAIIRKNPDRVVVVDEAYVDFGGTSAVPLIERYENLLVVQTFSKSRSFAGGRLGYAIGHPALIADLNALRCSTNPYNVNRLTLAAGEAALGDAEYYAQNCQRIIATRERTAARLRALGFSLTDSQGNFLFARYPGVSGAHLLDALRKSGILVRHFPKPRIEDYLRITVGSDAQMDALVEVMLQILKKEG